MASKIPKIFLSSILALSLSAISSFGATPEVQWGTLDFANGLGTADGTPLPVGDVALVGSFDITPAQITANGGNESFLMSNFITFGTAHIGDGFPSPFQPGYWIGDSFGNTNGMGINNAQIYYWVFNATTAVNATQYGIYTAPANASWKFPDSGSVTPVTTTDISDVPQNSSGILWGSYGTGTSSNGEDPLYNLANISAVPEPSTWTAAALAFGTVLSAAIRRNKRH